MKRKTEVEYIECDNCGKSLSAEGRRCGPALDLGWYKLERKNSTFMNAFTMTSKDFCCFECVVGYIEKKLKEYEALKKDKVLPIGLYDFFEESD